MRLILAGLLALAPASALSHSWYDPWCCSDKDCFAVHPDEITAGPDGYHYKQWVKPYAEAKVSADHDYHVCIYQGELRCLYAPAGGV